MKKSGTDILIKKYNNCKTMKQYFRLINSNKIDYHNFFTAISKNKKTDCFRFVTNIKNLNVKLNKKIVDADSSKKILGTEGKRLKQHNFNYGYDAYDIDGSLGDLIKTLKIYNIDAEINAQQPGQIKALHYDSCAGWIKKNFTEWEHSDLNHRLKQPKGMQNLHRIFVALTDWQPGWMVQFGGQQWTNWKKGDVITFDWRNVPHSTANASYDTRHLLKITAFVMKGDNNVLY